MAEELLRNAAKARLRRMVAEKRKRNDLAPPQWLKAESEKGTEQREQMALCLQQVNWDKAGSFFNSKPTILCPKDFVHHV